MRGILIGATLELIFLGNVAIGAAHPPDIVTGSVLATAFSIMSGRGPEAALTIAIPVSMLAQTLGIPGARGERPLWSSGGPLCGTG